MKHSIFTICSQNYIGQAATLMRSVREHEPQADRFIVLVDRKVPNPPVEDGLASVIWLEDLGIPEVEFKALIFDVLELNTNVKPTALRHLLRRYERCVYMDPDTVLYAPLEPVWRGLDDANVVVTPHMIESRLPTSYPWDRELLRHGGFNLGFVGAAATPETDRLLRWWEQCCLTCGFNAPADGFFVDQKFMDQAHVYFDGVKVLRHKGLNIAYWNLHERAVRRVGTQWQVGDDRLIFMHFSGFIFAPSVEDRLKISRYPSGNDLENRPELAPLFDDYRQRLKENRYGELSAIPYSFARFDNGVAVTQLARRLLGSGAVEVASRDEPFRADSAIYKTLLDLGALQAPSPGQPQGGRNRAAEGRQLAAGQRVLRWLYRRLGVRRYESLLKFMNFASSTLNQGFLVKR